MKTRTMATTKTAGTTAAEMAETKAQPEFRPHPQFQIKRPRSRQGRKERQTEYLSYSALAAGETEGVDYTKLFAEKPSPVLIAVLHGGTIEPGTSEIGASIAGDDLSLYCFEGLIPNRPHTDLHIESHLFDEPDGLRLAAAADVVVTVHGRKD